MQRTSSADLRLTFHGGAQTVTGANHLLESVEAKILIDCGLFQCPQYCSMHNYEKFAYAPEKIDALFVTHGHIDHIGRIPKLVRNGFRGRIISTKPTKEFAALLLEDSLGILEKEAEREGVELYYNMEDLKRSLSLWETLDYGKELQIKDLSVQFHDAGHILGSAMIKVQYGDRNLLFTGDLGNTPNPLLRPYVVPRGITHLIIESVYGDRVHENEIERKQKLFEVSRESIGRGGVLMIPSFAIERTQELLYEFNALIESEKLPSCPVFLDSPLAIKATKIYKKYSNLFNEHARKLIREGDDLFQFPNLTFTLRTDDSKSINRVPSPKIIIAGAGMMQGGRILHHAKRYLSSSQNTLLFIGYTASNSLGRRLYNGAKRVRIYGDNIPVKAKIRAIGGYSAHADHNDLMDFVENAGDSLKQVFAVQGEPKSAMYLAQRIREYTGINARAPRIGTTFNL